MQSQQCRVRRRQIARWCVFGARQWAAAVFCSLLGTRYIFHIEVKSRAQRSVTLCPSTGNKSDLESARKVSFAQGVFALSSEYSVRYLGAKVGIHRPVLCCGAVLPLVGKAFADSLGIDFYETSAKDSVNVEQVSCFLRTQLRCRSLDARILFGRCAGLHFISWANQKQKHSQQRTAREHSRPGQSSRQKRLLLTEVCNVYYIRRRLPGQAKKTIFAAAVSRAAHCIIPTNQPRPKEQRHTSLYDVSAVSAFEFLSWSSSAVSSHIRCNCSCCCCMLLLRSLLRCSLLA